VVAGDPILDVLKAEPSRIPNRFDMSMKDKKVSRVTGRFLTV
jgi:hypothetical protein